ncbi:MAG: undecaprenyl-diphosphatase UppP [Candidatus Lambdaproteobacteria bacterium]|nr:undecaprenyl-diphosphatase UppP [Candidatus Lambdaproteobacteria bacterium]
MSWVHGLVLGLVQGLTEFVPISSTAHLRIVPALLGWEDPGAAFSAVIQLGTLLAALVYFRADILRLTLAALRSLWDGETRARADARLAWAIAAGNVPIVAFGLAFRGFIETGARSLYLIAAMLIAVGLALVWAERHARQTLAMGELTLRPVLWIGLWQALALLPGASRSGATILGGLLVGLRRAEAAHFSFLLGLPAILGAALFELRPLLRTMGTEGGPDWGVLALGLAASALSGFAAIDFLLRYLRTRTTLAFAAYRLALGLALLALAQGGWVR